MTAVSTLPCVRLVIVTVTPGRTPPCESWTDSRNGGACRLRAKNCRIAREDEGYEHSTTNAFEPFGEPHGRSFYGNRIFARVKRGVPSVGPASLE